MIKTKYKRKRLRLGGVQATSSAKNVTRVILPHQKKKLKKSRVNNTIVLQACPIKTEIKFMFKQLTPGGIAWK